ncbi:aspartate/glutamate racemase family protein [Entomospira culicis]|uniref:Aspartate/glutamate racemase family protein n=1 Tax=Entomospira culicis TaxID=2719989 RepID=A0A968KUI4_9SPIO|nr:aspartate/glutamate racemase family protein [Entomospira culicis]NIZ18940.1 aspartate/glutamate racemase family protein [Entomospira culicis]NIZ69155.1 aspartate/glutamate racemase family protein [Entomospira culicis]WDI37742.1 aspartate/glutamate racemase family protein [Entomospira culicis]WDI39370.1 aspartate/glutamate racemase family protein [Entomospira culicis]
MRKIGLLGGMSWESTLVYYKLINEAVAKELGGLHSAKILLSSVDFAEIAELQARGDWQKSGEILAEEASLLAQAGADVIAICTNTMHKVAPRVSAQLSIPLLHIAQASADKLLAEGVSRVLLLGTKYTMTQDFYREALEQAGLTVFVPSAEQMDVVHHIIYTELCLGMIQASSRKQLQDLIEQMRPQGVQGVLLACTELGLLLSPQDVSIPLFDTTVIHAQAIATYALEKKA